METKDGGKERMNEQKNKNKKKENWEGKTGNKGRISVNIHSPLLH